MTLLPPDTVAALRGLLAALDRRAGASDAESFAARMRLIALRYVLRERPWALTADRLAYQETMESTFLGWLGESGVYPVALLGEVDAVIAALTRTMRVTPEPSHARLLRIESALRLDPLQSATLSVLVYAGQRDPELDVFLADHQMLSPAVFAHPDDQGLAESVVLSLLAEADGSDAGSAGRRLVQLEAAGLVSRASEGEGESTDQVTIKADPLLRVVVGAVDGVERRVGLMCRGYAGRPAMEALVASRWPQLRGARRALLTGANLESRRATAAAALGPGEQLVIRQGFGGPNAANPLHARPWLEAAQLTGATVELDDVPSNALLDFLRALPMRWIVTADASWASRAAHALGPVDVRLDLEAHTGPDGVDVVEAGEAIRRARLDARGVDADAALSKLHEVRLVQTVRPLVDPRCPDVLPARTREVLDEVLHVLKYVRRLRRARASGEALDADAPEAPPRLFFLLEGFESVLKRKAAFAMGRALGRPVVEIDTSKVISKYIGESEDRLRELFELAERTGAALYLENAHDLLGRRTEVKQAGDRYASMQVNYMLQSLDTFDGAFIFTSDKPAAMDAALLRRILYRVPFVQLSVEERERFYRAMIPDGAPMHPKLRWRAVAEATDIGPDAMQRVVFDAALRAAQAGSRLRTRHVFDALEAFTRE